MCKKTLFVGICLSLVLGTLGVSAQNAGEAAGMPSEADMQKMIAAMTPGAEHKLLEGNVGSWNYTMTMWMAPGAPPATSTGTAESTSILGGRYISSVFRGSFMGMPFEGRGLDGYDNLAKTYKSVWVDNMSTWPMISTGTASADGKTLSMIGESPDPTSGKMINMRSVTTRTSADGWTMEMYMTDPASGQEFKTMEMVATRAKQ